MELIPDLPNDVARECLSRVSYQQLPAIASVCKKWRMEINVPEFSRHRRANGRSQRLLVMAQAVVDADRKQDKSKKFTPPVYRLTVFEPSAGDWYELPPIPDLHDCLPMFCHLAAVGSELVVLGGLNPVTWEVSDSVYIFNFVSYNWRCGARMPSPRRSFFGCASDSLRRVFVAGGHDEDKNALRSAIVYDVPTDSWFSLPDMTEERDECKAAYRAGTLLVIGGYSSDRQGQFGRSAESFDLEAWKWGKVEEDFLYDSTCPRTCTTGCDDGVYACKVGELLVRRGGIWERAAKLPVEVVDVAHVECLQEKIFVLGAQKFGYPHVSFFLDTRSGVTEKLANGEDFSGHVQTGCCLEI